MNLRRVPHMAPWVNITSIGQAIAYLDSPLPKYAHAVAPVRDNLVYGALVVLKSTSKN